MQQNTVTVTVASNCSEALGPGEKIEGVSEEKIINIDDFLNDINEEDEEEKKEKEINAKKLKDILIKIIEKVRCGDKSNLFEG